jgi:hypothetical protein
MTKEGILSNTLKEVIRWRFFDKIQKKYFFIFKIFATYAFPAAGRMVTFSSIICHESGRYLGSVGGESVALRLGLRIRAEYLCATDARSGGSGQSEPLRGGH